MFLSTAEDQTEAKLATDKEFSPGIIAYCYAMTARCTLVDIVHTAPIKDMT